MINKLVLGTVQFGLNYGINNSSGKPSQEAVFEMLDTAFESGINCLDTADAYGDAIQLIGKYHGMRPFRFKILSKFKDLQSGKLLEQAEKSLISLKIDKFEVYSFHSYIDYLEHPEIAEELYSLKKINIINSTGISVYTNAQIDKVLSSDKIDVIQAPYNILDNKNIRGRHLELTNFNHKETHIRSVFLQGLFFLNELPDKLKPLNKYISQIRSYCSKNNISMHQLSLSYAIFNSTISKVLIGVDNKEQLIANINAIHFNKEAFNFIDENIKVLETELLNPVNWK